MNRILVDRKYKDDNVVTLNIMEDSSFLLSDNKINKYIFNVKNANVNILCNFKDIDNVSFEFNIDNACVDFNNLSYNCKDQNIIANLNKSNSFINIYNSYVSKNKQNIDVRVLHNSSNTESKIFNNAVTCENGSICFNNITEVKNKMKDCKVVQDAKIIPLNDTNENMINPILLIDEFEVDAKHAAFIGKFKEEQLFYLESRGLTKKEAIKLLLDGLLVGLMNISEEEKESLKQLI